jgi:hypothetical protein
MEQKICPCCNETFDAGTILLDRRLKNSMERYTVTGFHLCPNCYKEGFILMVEIDDPLDNKIITPQKVHRTGKIAYIKKETFSKIFNVPNHIPFYYGRKEIFAILESLNKQSEEA